MIAKERLVVFSSDSPQQTFSSARILTPALPRSTAIVRQRIAVNFLIGGFYHSRYLPGELRGHHT
jgi:hypothetical protein